MPEADNLTRCCQIEERGIEKTLKRYGRLKNERMAEGVELV